MTDRRIASRLIDEAAGRLESRRAFLRIGTASLASAFLAACGSAGPPSVDPALKFARRRNEVVERWLFDSGAVDVPDAGARVAGRRFPAYHVSKLLPTWDSASQGPWSLAVAGLVRMPLRLSLADLMALPRTEQRVDHFCVEGWNAVARFSGVRVRELARLAGASSAARYVDFESFDDGYHESWDIESAMHPQTLVVYGKDGDPLSADYGAPARVHSPVKLGYKNTKYLTRVVFSAQRTGGYWTDRGYEWYGGT